jgi:hypothetical protein
MMKLKKAHKQVNNENLKETIESLIKNSIDYFASTLRVTCADSVTHKLIIIDGWNDNSTSRYNIASYLVGIRASAIDAALNIHAALIGNNLRSKEIIYKSVISIIGDSPVAFSEKQKSDQRNPWICEGLWHLCMATSNVRNEIHPSGKVIGLNPVHVNAKDHGLDGLAIYEKNDRYGLTIIESKAYKTNPSLALSNAAKFFKEVDEDEYSGDIFQAVQVIRLALPNTKQEYISNMFWDKERSYIVNPHYDSQINYDWLNKKPSLQKLSLEKSNILIMPDIINDFDEFFDDISKHMRNIAEEL